MMMSTLSCTGLLWGRKRNLKIVLDLFLEQLFQCNVNCQQAPFLRAGGNREGRDGEAICSVSTSCPHWLQVMLSLLLRYTQVVANFAEQGGPTQTWFLSYGAWLCVQLVPLNKTDPPSFSLSSLQGWEYFYSLLVHMPQNNSESKTRFLY